MNREKVEEMLKGSNLAIEYLADNGIAIPPEAFQLKQLLEYCLDLDNKLTKAQNSIKELQIALSTAEIP